jgi:hypothetical protein
MLNKMARAPRANEPLCEANLQHIVRAPPVTGGLALAVGYLINVGLGALLTALQRPAYREWVATYGKPTRRASGCLIPVGVAVGTVTLYCLCAVGTLVVEWRIFTEGPHPNEMLITDPAEVADVAESMADYYDLPPGYHEEKVFDTPPIQDAGHWA